MRGLSGGGIEPISRGLFPSLSLPSWYALAPQTMANGTNGGTTFGSSVTGGRVVTTSSITGGMTAADGTYVSPTPLCTHRILANTL